MVLIVVWEKGRQDLTVGRCVMLSPEAPGAHVDQHEAALCFHLHVATIEVHPSDHAALGRHVCPVDHLPPVVKVQGNCIVQALGLGWEQGSQLPAGHMWIWGRMAGGRGSRRQPWAPRQEELRQSMGARKA